MRGQPHAQQRGWSGQVRQSQPTTGWKAPAWMALMARPRLLMIDEPFLGLSPRVVHEIGAVIKQIHREGITVIFIEQNVELALRLAHRGYVMESGRTILEGPSAELLQSAEVKRIFLGG